MKLTDMVSFTLTRKEYWRNKSLESGGHSYTSCRANHSVECENYAKFMLETPTEEMFDKNTSMIKSTQGIFELIFHNKVVINGRSLKLIRVNEKGEETHVFRVFNPTILDLVNKVELTERGKNKLGIC